MSYWSAFAKKYPSRAMLRLDGGSVFSNGMAASPVINRYMIEGTYKSNLDAILLSSWDLPVWQEMGDLASAGLMPREFLNLPLVSSNVTAKLPNFPAIQRYIIKELKVDPQAGKPFRVAITGLLSDPEERISKKDFEVVKPADAVRRVVEELGGKADYIIVLTDLGIGEAISLAVLTPGIHMLVVSHDYQAPTDAQQVADTMIVGPINEGRMLSEVRLNVKSGSQKLAVEAHTVALDRTIPDDPAMGDLIRKAQVEVDKVKK